MANKKIHSLSRFIENTHSCECSCGEHHALTKRAHGLSETGTPLSEFEYSETINKIVYSDDVEKILKEIGGLFH